MKLISAVPLTADQKTRIMDKMAKKIGEATFFVTEEVDPTVMGGVRLESENHYFDNTVASPMSLLRFVRHCEVDTFFQMAIASKVQILPLTKQLTTLAGNAW